MNARLWRRVARVFPGLHGPISAYDYFNHLRLKPLPVMDLPGLTLQYDGEILSVNSEQDNGRPGCVRCPKFVTEPAEYGLSPLESVQVIPGSELHS